jgi:hypothetical protein
MNFEDDVIVPSDEQLRRVAALISNQLILEEAVADLEEALAKRKEELEKITARDLPALMQELGLSEVRLADGTRLSINHKVQASIKEANKPQAFAWLRKNGHGSLIKTEVNARFGRGDEKKATRLFTQLYKKGYEATLKESVHPQTLGAFVREQLAEARQLPMELLGVFEYDLAVIKKEET